MHEGVGTCDKLRPLGSRHAMSFQPSHFSHLTPVPLSTVLSWIPLLRSRGCGMRINQALHQFI